MKPISGIPLNIGFFEALGRILLIIPAGGLVVLAIVTMHTYLFIPIPSYLLATALTKYGPLKHIYRILMHKPVFTGESDLMLIADFA